MEISTLGNVPVYVLFSRMVEFVFLTNGFQCLVLRTSAFIRKSNLFFGNG